MIAYMLVIAAMLFAGGDPIGATFIVGIAAVLTLARVFLWTATMIENARRHWHA